MIIGKGDKAIGAFKFPDMKKPHICYQDGNKVYDYGRFNSEDSAIAFMKHLCEFFGIDLEEERTE